MNKEIWKDIKWYEWLYQISNIGRVRSFHWMWTSINTKTPRILSTKWLIGRWYKRCSLKKDWKYSYFLIHRLVALMFIPNQYNKEQVNHKNGVKTDNRLENLEWMTSSENRVHSYRVLNIKHPQKWKKWKLCKNSKKVNQYTLDWKFIKMWYAVMDIQRSLWIKESSIRNCCYWKVKQSGWYYWEYIL